MFKLVYTNRFNKDVKLLQKRGFVMEYLKKAIIALETLGELSAEYKPHKLSGNYSGYWEAHIKSDWIILWQNYHDENEIWLTRTGTHSDLF